jgi:hypothetical protein
MAHLAGEFRDLTREANVPTPALDTLAAYVDPAKAPLPMGSAVLAISWRTVWIAAAALLTLVAGIAIGKSKRKSS